MRKLAFLLCWVALNSNIIAQVPSFGKSSTFDVACWNVEWFGSTSNGPSNETRQFDNVLEVLRNSKVDVWGLQEISSTATFNKLLDSLPKYNGVIAPYSQTQKTALVYDTSMFNLLYSKVVLTQYDYDFASGRFPFEVGLTPKNKPQDTLIILVIHLKANIGNNSSKQIAWERRKNASGYMYDYLNSTYPNLKSMIIGDFNDDTDVSIFNSNTTPFTKFLNDGTRYSFLTTGLSAANEGSTVGRSDMVDHILISNEWFSTYKTNSCQRMRLDNYLSSYSSSTSDHYPIFASFNENYNSIADLRSQSNFIYPNPMSTHKVWNNPNGIEITSITNYNGQALPVNYLELKNKEKGLYFIQYKLKGKQYSQKVLVN